MRRAGSAGAGMRRAGRFVMLCCTAAALAGPGPAQNDRTEPPASQPAGGATSQPATRPAAPTASGLAEAVAAAHNRPGWLAREALQCHITVEFAGEPVLDGVMLYDIRGGRVRLTLADGTTLVYDGSSAWVSPSDAAFAKARFHLLTWPYFLAVPFKLDDAGANLQAEGIQPLQGKVYRTTRLTFDAGVGDSPEDWYLLYTDLTTDTLRAMAYVVTYDRTVEEAAAEPHAITYHDFAILSGVVISRRWRFWQWNEEEGLVGEPIGQALLGEIRFVDADQEAFVRPADAREDRPPER